MKIRKNELIGKVEIARSGFIKNMRTEIGIYYPYSEGDKFEYQKYRNRFIAVCVFFYLTFRVKFYEMPED